MGGLAPAIGDGDREVRWIRRGLRSAGRRLTVKVSALETTRGAHKVRLILLAQLMKQRLGVLQVGGVEPSVSKFV